jgi:hypothetical protein
MGSLVLVAVMAFFFKEYEYSRVVIIYFWLLSIGVVWFSRAAFREALRFARRRGYNLRQVVIVGDGEPVAAVLQRIQSRPDVGLHILGLVGDDKDGARNGRWLGGYADLRAILDSREVDHVIIALAHEDYARLPGLLDAIGDEPVTIHVVPDLFRFTSLRGGVEDFEGIPFIHLRDSPLHGWSRIAKRSFDMVFSATLLVVLSPVMAAIALGVKLTSPGPILYPQDRMGLDGQRFRMLKFRTMRRDRSGPRRGTPAGRASARSSGASASTNCPSSSTCCAGR